MQDTNDSCSSSNGVVLSVSNDPLCSDVMIVPVLKGMTASYDGTGLAMRGSLYSIDKLS
jgi:hypothetical protein